MNQYELETKIEGLKKAIAEHSDFTNNYKSDLAKAEQQLKDYNKIALPPVVFDDIYEAVEKAIEQFDFSDTDNFDIEYGIDYDGRVNCESHEMTDTSQLVELIVEKVSRIFTEADAPEDEPTADQINTTTTAEMVFDRDTDKTSEAKPVEEEITVDGGETEVTVTPTEEEMEDFNKKIEETKEKKFKKRTWF